MGLEDDVPAKKQKSLSKDMKDQIISIKKPLQNIEVKVDSSGAKEVATKPIIELPEPDVSYLNVFFSMGSITVSISMLQSPSLHLSICGYTAFGQINHTKLHWVGLIIGFGVTISSSCWSIQAMTSLLAWTKELKYSF